MKCLFLGCESHALWGYLGQPAECCAVHRLCNMVEDPEKVCIRSGCENWAVFGKDVPQWTRMLDRIARFAKEGHNPWTGKPGETVCMHESIFGEFITYGQFEGSRLFRSYIQIRLRYVIQLQYLLYGAIYDRYIF